MQKQRKKSKASPDDISQQLATVASLLAKVLNEIKANEAQLRLSPRAQKSLEQGLKDLKEGRVQRYKSVQGLAKAVWG